ncbi:unnamed protein product [Protopolystoma xenopodis]|uniref:Uncharacterized protein n=1 Tax=Protopolystoma xenopodis TaxID=117903 RepID=A0A448WD19_9PLAT|nr:unnamed protein product [Protopolystoma xenopodis]
MQTLREGCQRHLGKLPLSDLCGRIILHPPTPWYRLSRPEFRFVELFLSTSTQPVERGCLRRQCWWVEDGRAVRHKCGLLWLSLSACVFVSICLLFRIIECAPAVDDKETRPRLEVTRLRQSGSFPVDSLQSE